MNVSGGRFEETGPRRSSIFPGGFSHTDDLQRLARNRVVTKDRIRSYPCWGGHEAGNDNDELGLEQKDPTKGVQRREL